MTEIIRAAGERLRLVPCRRHHGPPPQPRAALHHQPTGQPGPGAAAPQDRRRRHQLGRVLSGLTHIGFYDRPDTVMVSSLFAEDENAHDVSRYQLKTITDYVTEYRK